MPETKTKKKKASSKKKQSNNGLVYIDPCKWLRLDNAKTIREFVREDKINYFKAKEYRRLNPESRHEDKHGPSGKPDSTFKLDHKFWTTPARNW